MKKALLSLLIIILIVAGGLYGLLRIYATPDRIRDLLSARAGEALGLEVTLESATPSLFPPGAVVEGVVLENPAGGEAEPLARLERGKVSLRLFPLFSKRIEISGALLDGLHVTLVRDENGELILPAVSGGEGGDGAPSGATSADGPAGGKAKRGGAGDFALLLSLGEIRNGSLKIVDGDAAELVKVDTINIRTSVEMEGGGGRLTAAGEVLLAGISSVDLAAAGYEKGIAPVTVEHRLSIDLQEKLATIERMDGTLGDLPFTVTGEIRGFEGPPSGALRIESTDMPLADLLALAPGSQEGPWKGMSGNGPLSLVGDILLRGEEPPTYRFLLDIGGVDAKLANFPEPIRQIRGAVEATDERVAFTGISAEIGGRILTIDGTIDRYDDPRLSVAVEGEIDLAAVTRTGILPEGASVAGIVSIAARAEGAIRDPGRMKLTGNIDLAGGSAELPGLAVPVSRIEGRARLLTGSVEIDSLRLTAGRTELLARLTLDDPLGDAKIKLNASSPMIDLDQFLPPPDSARRSGREGEAPSPAASPASGAPSPVAPPIPLIPPIPALNGTGRIVADTLITGGNTLTGVVLDFILEDGTARSNLKMRQGRFGEVVVRGANSRLVMTETGIAGVVTADSALAALVPFSSARADIRITPEGKLELTDVDADLYDGKVTGTATVLFSEPGVPVYRFDVEAVNLNANDFLSKITPAKNVLYGKFNMTSEWEGRGLDPEEFLKNLKASGDAVTLDGELKNLEAINQVASFLGLSELKEQRFRSLQSGFSVANGRFSTDGVSMTSGTASWLASGSVGFDGSLDYDLSMTLSEAMSEKLKQKSSLSSLFADEQGRVVLDFNIGGNTKKPAVAYDVSKTTSRAGVGSIGSIIEALDKDGAIQGAIDRFFGGGSKKKKEPDGQPGGD